MNRSLGATDAARRPEPERDVLLACPCRGELERTFGKQLVPMQATVLRFAYDDDMLKIRLRVQYGYYLVEDARMSDENPRLTFPQEVIVVGCSRGSVRRYRDGADLDDTEVRGGKLRAVRQQQQDSLPLLQTQVQERVANAICVGSHLAVGAIGFAASNRDFRC